MADKASYMDYIPVFNTLNEAIIIFDTEKYLWANDAFAKIRGYDSPNELIGQSIFSNVHPDEIQEHTRVMAERSRTRENSKGVWRLRKKDGSYIPIIAHTSIIPDSNRGISVAIIRPVDVVQGDIIPKINEAGVRNELSSALTVIYGYLELLMDHEAVSLFPELRKWFKAIDGNVNRIKATIDIIE